MGLTQRSFLALVDLLHCESMSVSVISILVFFCQYISFRQLADEICSVYPLLVLDIARTGVVLTGRQTDLQF